MSEYVLSFNPAGVSGYPYGAHDSSAVLLRDGDVVFAAEEERFTRDKHAKDAFPNNAIRACLDAGNLALSDIDRILLPWVAKLKSKNLGTDLARAVRLSNSLPKKLYRIERVLESNLMSRTVAKSLVRERLAEIDSPVPPISQREHHRCHAASAFHPSGFDEALVVTADGKGEYDCTVVWRADEDGLKRLRTYDFPNSLGHFYRITTVMLGYSAESRSEGKIMGLAPYGSYNEEIDRTLRSLVDIGVEYDVTALTKYGVEKGVQRLEDAFGSDRKSEATAFTDWEKDLAFMTQHLLEETIVAIVERYCEETGLADVALSGGVALNCKMNKAVMESPVTDDVFIQPVASDAGISLGACQLEYDPEDIPTQSTVYWGPTYDSAEIKSMLETNKIAHFEPDDLSEYVARSLADGDLVGWFQGRMEMGPRALGHRSILADPRSAESRDRVNKFVKHREEWRPFAPSMLESAVDDYLVDGERAPFMIKTFDVVESKRDEIEAVLHPGDQTTRPQTVNPEQAERYHALISSFEEITGVPVVLNTSFNDHGEPIVNQPAEAVKDFFNMGLDVLVLEDVVIEKGETCISGGG